MIASLSLWPRMFRLTGLCLAVLLLSGCSFVRIHNVSDAAATVNIRVPDNSRGYTRYIAPGRIVDVFTGHGGSYTVTTIPSEWHRTSLKNLETQITNRLFNERATLTADNVRQLTENLNQVLRLQEELDEPGVTCSGYVPDFETAIVTIAWDAETVSWALACS